MAVNYYGGVEGGASNSKFVLVQADGVILASCEGMGTNQYLIGVDECLKRIVDLIKEGLQAANLPVDMCLHGLGMSISGGDEKMVQEAIQTKMQKNYLGVAKYIFIGSDTQSALATALPNGGVVLIAGTGSNCQLINPDGSMGRCGGWGHMVGDEASACWISLRAIKTYFDAADNFRPCPHSTDKVRDLMYSYYNVEDRAGMLDHLYSKFDKATFSGFCSKLAKEGMENGDPLCCEVFREAGRLLARHLYGISPHISQDLMTQSGGLSVVCQGSVFKSWKLLEPGFIEEMKSTVKESNLKEITLLRLDCEAMIGAAALGAKASGNVIPLDYAENSSVFYHGTF